MEQRGDGGQIHLPHNGGDINKVRGEADLRLRHHQHRRTLDLAAAQAVQSLVGLLEGEKLDLGLNRHLRRYRQQFLTILTGQVGH